MDKVIRVLVANRPRLMRELLVETLKDQLDIEIVGEVSDDAEIADRVKETSPDVVVISLDEPGKRPAICDRILRPHPEVLVIAVAPQQNRTTCYWMSSHIHADDIETSEAGLLNAVRSTPAGMDRAS